MEDPAVVIAKSCNGYANGAVDLRLLAGRHPLRAFG